MEEKFKDRDKLEGGCNSESEDFTTSSTIQDALKDLPEVSSFIKKLQDYIVRQQTLIHRLYAKLKEETGGKKLCLSKDESTQTCKDEFKELSAFEPTTLVEDIKKAAENAVQQSGFVYDPSYGMYYDYNTGYYYNAELGLYYDGHSGIYYYFDESSKSFQFHSQVPVASEETTLMPSVSEDTVGGCVKRKQDVGNDVSKEIPKKTKLDLKEEGECSDSESGEENEVTIVSEPVPICDTSNSRCNDETEDCAPIAKPSIDQTYLPEDELAKAWPCLRVVVKETGLDNLVVGTLFMVTCTGGTLGREGDHAIVIPDINISKHHAKVSFSEEERSYNIVDLGSRNGTYVDGRRISVALRESDPVALQHGTLVKVGTTRLECHVHVGHDTCHDCEPGCAQQKPPAKPGGTDKDHETREARHRSELRRLRKRFGLDKLTVKEVVPTLAEGYSDRAEQRRRVVGSLDHHEKTESASVHQSIKSSNKGFKMLSKMGWAEGQSLGKDATAGITEPVTVEQRPEKAGLGADVVHLPTDPRANKKSEIWKKAQKRFQELEEQ